MALETQKDYLSIDEIIALISGIADNPDITPEEILSKLNELTQQVDPARALETWESVFEYISNEAPSKLPLLDSAVQLIVSSIGIGEESILNIRTLQMDYERRKKAEDARTRTVVAVWIAALIMVLGGIGLLTTRQQDDELRKVFEQLNNFQYDSLVAADES